MKRRRTFNIGPCVVLVPCAVVACNGGGSSSGGTTTLPDGATTSTTSTQCTNKEKGTEFADCKTDGDCYSGYCNASCHPAPCCENPNTTAMKAGRGYSCQSDSDCAKVASDFIARGGSGRCIQDNVNGVSNGCSFTCASGSASASGTSGGGTSGGGTSSGGTSGSGSGTSGGGTSSGSGSGSG